MAVSGNTLLVIGKAVARELGPYTEFTATSTSGANDLVISTALADAEAAAERYGGYYLYAHSGGPAGQQQRVKRNGFTGSTGTLQTAASFANTPPTGGIWSLLGVMPWISQDGLIGIRECINRSLRKRWVIDRYEISATTGTREYDLTMWWASKRCFIRLLDPEDTVTGRMDPATQGWRIVQDGETWTLQLDQGYATGETFALVVERPANSRMYISGSWAEQSSPVAGLVLDADACLGSWNDAYQCALYECYAALAVQAGGARKSYWREKLEEQRNVVSMIKLFEMDKESVTLGEGSSDAPSTWTNVRGDHSFWSS